MPDAAETGLPQAKAGFNRAGNAAEGFQVAFCRPDYDN